SQAAPRVGTTSDKPPRLPEPVAGVTAASVVELLRRRAAEQPDDPAYIFLPDRGGEPVSLSFAELYARARELGCSLAARGEKGDRAALLFAPGLNFIVAFFGCLMAGVIAVPMMIPRRDSARDASAAILADCSPCFAMTRRDLVTDARPELMERFGIGRLDWVFVDCRRPVSAELRAPLPLPAREDIALLQYTSGSTSSPKGVMVSHRNLIENSEMICIALGNTGNSTHVSWVPLYHDM